MFFAQTAEWTALGRALMGDLAARFAGQGFDFAKASLVLTAPSSFGAVGFAHRGGVLQYPAGLTAPFHMVHALAAQEAGRIAPHPDFDRALRDMVLWSSDSAANYVIDLLTGTTGDTALEGAEYLDWASKRARLDRFFWQLGWPEWEGCRILQKQGGDFRYGREARLAGEFGEGLNMLSPLCAARLLWELFEGDLPLAGPFLRPAQAFLARDGASPDAVFPNFGLAEFLGGALPSGAKLWSKPAHTGWTGDAKTSWVKHDMARISVRGHAPLHVVLMTQSRGMAANSGLFGALGRVIWDHAAPLLRDVPNGDAGAQIGALLPE
jgi:hypothetical protein